MTEVQTLLDFAKQGYEEAPRCLLSAEKALAYAKRRPLSEMKNRRWAIAGALLGALSFLLALPLGLTLASKREASPNSAALLREAMLEKAQAYYQGQILPEGLSLSEDYGDFSGVYVARFSGVSCFEGVSKETLPSAQFVYPNANGILAYDGLNLYSLKDAYRNLLLKSEELQTIAKESRIHWPWKDEEAESAFELHGDAIVLQTKTLWNGLLGTGDSRQAIDLTVDWNFNAHFLTLKDLPSSSSYSDVSCLTPEYFEEYKNGYPREVNQRYRLTLVPEGEDALRQAIGELEKEDFVKSVAPAQAS